jgi:predicted DNA binding CopG/RHH family protein
MRKLMTKKKSDSEYLEESDRWDEMSLQQLMDIFDPVDDGPTSRRPPRKAISLRVDEEIIEGAKEMAWQLGLGYQTLFRLWLIEGFRRFKRREDNRIKRGAGERDLPPSRAAQRSSATSAAGRSRRPSLAPRPRSGRGVGSKSRG